MKLISLWEPWASLMAIGAKRIETRSWSTDYRGWLAIHASKGGLNQSQLQKTCFENSFYSALQDLPSFREQIEAPVRRKGWIKDVFPHGCIVAVVNLANVYRTDLCTGPTEYLSELRERYAVESAFGDYHPGRFAWLTNKRFQLLRPIPFKAAQGLVNLPSETVLQLRAQWNASRDAGGVE